MANYFLHPNELKATAYVDENADDKILTNGISIAQDLYILPIMGTGIYEELKTQIGAGTLTVLNTTLLASYVVPALRYWCLYELAEPLTYKITNKAIVKKHSENSEPIEFKELTALKDKFMNIAQWYTERLKFYLIENRTSYPLYDSPGTGIDTIRPAHDTAFNCGWYLGESTQNVPDFIKAEFPLTYGTL